MGWEAAHRFLTATRASIAHKKEYSIYALHIRYYIGERPRLAIFAFSSRNLSTTPSENEQSMTSYVVNIAVGASGKIIARAYLTHTDG